MRVVVCLSLNFSFICALIATKFGHVVGLARGSSVKGSYLGSKVPVIFGVQGPLWSKMVNNINAWSEELLMQAEDDDDDLHLGQGSSIVNYAMYMTTTLDQKNC